MRPETLSTLSADPGAETAGDLLLGDPVDLWAGLKPRFPDWGSPWRRPPGRLLRPEIPEIPSGEPVLWDEPILSFHDSVPGLLSHLFDYTVTPMVRLDGPQEVTAGALMAGQSLAGLEDRLTFPLSERREAGSDVAYLLVRLQGQRGTRYYTPDWQGLNRKLRILHWLTPEGRHALARLRLRGMRHEGVEFFGDITARLANRYLGMFEGFGTHVVRSIRYGACLFQVFEVAAKAVPVVREAIVGDSGSCPVRGPAAFGLSHFTRSPWVTRGSPILSVGDCSGAQAVTQDPLWRDGSGPACLLSSRARALPDRTAVLDRMVACSPVAVSFSCQALSLEDFRADAWARIMRAGLCQRFPGIRLSGWRQRNAFSLPAFLASAGLTGEDALCKGPGPVVAEVIFVLDLRRSAPLRGHVSAPLAFPEAGCLALFAVTDPASGEAAEYRIGAAAFDPATVTVPFVDGALCLTTARGDRICLTEGVWLGPQEDGRPGIIGDPARCDGGMLNRHAGLLTGYLHLIGVLQGGGGPAAADPVMRRCAAWLAEVTTGQEELTGLRWQALRQARGGRVLSAVPAPVREGIPVASLVPLLRACRDALARHPASTDCAAALHAAEQALHAVYSHWPDIPDPDGLDQRCLTACEAVEQQFAALAALPDLPEQVTGLFSAGAALRQPPDPRRTPHAVVPGEEPFVRLWNALLGVRAQVADCRAHIAAARGQMAEAMALLEQEVLAGWECPADPVGEFLAALEALSETLPGISRADRDRLCAGIGAIMALGGPVRVLAGAAASHPEKLNGLGLQMRRLLVVLGALQACRTAGLALPPVESLTPAVLMAHVGLALTALEPLRVGRTDD